MRHDFIDRYSRLNSPIHRLPTGVKLAGSICIIIATVALQLSVFWAFILVACVLLAIAAAAKIPWGFMIRRLLFLEPFALGIAVMAFFQENGLSVFLSIVTKSTICLFTVILFSNTTPFADLLLFLQRMGTPRILVTIMALMYRYLFVLIDEGERLNRARKSRTFTTSRIHRWQLLGSLIGQLFIRSTERAERIFAAMTARGWR
jgi:cobalt/nickel transport system permease protein